MSAPPQAYNYKYYNCRHICTMSINIKFALDRRDINPYIWLLLIEQQQQQIQGTSRNVSALPSVLHVCATQRLYMSANNNTWAVAARWHWQPSTLWPRGLACTQARYRLPGNDACMSRCPNECTPSINVHCVHYIVCVWRSFTINRPLCVCG